MLAIDTAALVVLIPLTIASVTSSVVTIINAFKNKETADITRDIQHQVTTINGRSLAQLGDATESRRIEALPHKDRTEADEEHLEVAPAPDE